MNRCGQRGPSSTVKRVDPTVRTKSSPLGRGNLLVWALNLGIARIVKQHSNNVGAPVRAAEQAVSVFETMPPAG
jgi:hypothetical protein